MASLTSPMIPATTSWLAAFTVCPAPWPPTWTMVLPRCSRIGRACSKVSSSPPTMIDSVPSMAPGSPPLTGASSTRTPDFLACSATATEVSGAIVLMSMSSRSGPAEARTPFSPSTTSVTSGESGSIVITTSAPVTASSMLPAGLPPACTRRSVDADERA